MILGNSLRVVDLERVSGNSNLFSAVVTRENSPYQGFKVSLSHEQVIPTVLSRDARIIDVRVSTRDDVNLILQ